MKCLMLFTDGSVSPHTKIGFGAYLAVSNEALSLDELKPLVKVRRFEHTSSTKLEMQTLVWALNELRPLNHRVIVHTDSQNIIGLKRRRDRLEENDYRTKKNIRIKNYELYKIFFRLTDQLDCEFVKLRGHKGSNHKDGLDRLFTLVDRASRKALREEIP